MLDAFLHGQIAAWLTSPWLIVVAVIIRVITTMLAIRAGRQATLIGRLDFVVFLVVLTMILFMSFVSMTLVVLGLDNDDLLVIVLLIAYQATMYFCVKWSVQRLRSIGWSPNWAWLLNVDGLAYVVMAILCIMPPAANSETANSKTANSETGNSKTGNGETDMATPAAI
jgi:uncharacterized membrane protein YhaH (DUF805 family)